MMNNFEEFKVSELITNLKKSKIYASSAKEIERYKFYMCSEDFKYIDEYTNDHTSILISTGGEFYVHYAENKYSYSTDVWGIKVKSKKILDKYLYYYLHSKKEEINSKGFQGSGLKHLDKNYLKEFKIYVPNIEQQKKIISFFSKFDKFIHIIKNKIEKLENLQNSLQNRFFKEIFSFKKSTIENNNRYKLSEVCELSRGKFSHRPRNDPRFYGGKIPFIQTGDVPKYNIYIDTYSQTLNEKGLEVSKLFKKGTLVITIAANIGDVGILNFDTCFPDSLVGITPIDKNKTDILFILFFFKTYKKILDNIASKSTQKNINLELLNNIEIILPEINQQKKIASILSKNLKIIHYYNNKLHKIQSMKKFYIKEIFKNG